MRSLLSIVLAFLLVTPFPAWSFNWSSVAKKLAESTFSLQTADGRIFCSGWVTDNQRDFGMTANHCMHGNDPSDSRVFVDGIQVFEIEGNENLDYTVLYINGIDRPELKARTKPIVVGIEVGAFGFARETGLYDHFRAGVVSAIKAPVDGLEGEWIVFDQPGIGGMSGGPIVDIQGKVVSMSQRSDRRLTGLGRSIREIYKVTEKYWKN